MLGLEPLLKGVCSRGRAPAPFHLLSFEWARGTPYRAFFSILVILTEPAKQNTFILAAQSQTLLLQPSTF